MFFQSLKTALKSSNSHSLLLKSFKLYRPLFTNSTYSSSSFQTKSNFLLNYLGGLIAIDFFYTLYQDKSYKYQLIKTITKGTQPEINISPLQYTPRSEIVKDLKKIFKPHEDQSEYYIIYGEHGIGKTTLIKTALKEIGQGVIYVDIPANLDKLDDAFKKAFNFKSNGFILTRYIIKKIFGNGKFFIIIILFN
jgi:hypothetical protein